MDDLADGVIEQPQFLYVPVPDGSTWYKAEAVNTRGSAANGWVTTKINRWNLPDRRGNLIERPHNHPWDFTATILQGSYTEERYWVDTTGKVRSEICRYQEGDTNDIGTDVFHEVIEVTAGTLTHMRCVGEPQPWGYLHITGTTGEFLASSTAPDHPDFKAHLRAWNPHHPQLADRPPTLGAGQ